MQGFQNDISQVSAYSQLLVCVDESWLLALEDKGITKTDDLKTVLKLIEQEAAERHPIHNRTMKLLNTKQTGNLLDLARSLNSRTMIVEWSSWRREAAILDLFLHIKRDEEGKKIAHKIIQENPEGDYGKLIEDLSTLETH